ncbi:hypothetical protein GJ496_006958 [Pomphorhynchus laevis]|nr:hypothetical protein GJ496_006958 [Pomphorhynchus laevis]
MTSIQSANLFRHLFSYECAKSIDFTLTDSPYVCEFNTEQMHLNKSGDVLAIGCQSGLLQLNKVQEGQDDTVHSELLCKLEPHKNAVMTMCWMPVSPYNYLYTAGADRSLYIYDVSTQQVVNRIRPNINGYINTINTSRDNCNIILAAGTGGVVNMFDLRCSKKQNTYPPIQYIDMNAECFSGGHRTCSQLASITGITFIDYGLQTIGVSTLNDSLFRIFDIRRTYMIKRNMPIEKLQIYTDEPCRYHDHHLSVSDGISCMTANSRQLRYFFNTVNEHLVQYLLSGSPVEDYDYVRSESCRLRIFYNDQMPLLTKNRGKITSDFRNFVFTTNGHDNIVRANCITVSKQSSDDPNITRSNSPLVAIRAGNDALTSISVSSTGVIATCSNDMCVYLIAPSGKQVDLSSLDFSGCLHNGNLYHSLRRQQCAYY